MPRQRAHQLGITVSSVDFEPLRLKNNVGLDFEGNRRKTSANLLRKHLVFYSKKIGLNSLNLLFGFNESSDFSAASSMKSKLTK